MGIQVKAIVKKIKHLKFSSGLVPIHSIKCLKRVYDLFKGYLTCEDANFLINEV